MICMPFNVTIATQETVDEYIRNGIIYEDESGLHVSENVKPLPTTNQNKG